jgi:hypothetical protein
VTSAINPQPNTAEAIEHARSRWTAACEKASAMAKARVDAGVGNSLELARIEAERLFLDYQDIERRRTQEEMLQLQRSQQLATWASFSVAAAVGVATIVGIVLQLVK